MGREWNQTYPFSVEAGTTHDARRPRRATARLLREGPAEFEGFVTAPPTLHVAASGFRISLQFAPPSLRVERSRQDVSVVDSPFGRGASSRFVGAQVLEESLPRPTDPDCPLRFAFVRDLEARHRAGRRRRHGHDDQGCHKSGEHQSLHRPSLTYRGVDAARGSRPEPPHPRDQRNAVHPSNRVTRCLPDDRPFHGHHATCCNTSTLVS
jgi:hypothetical protein